MAFVMALACAASAVAAGPDFKGALEVGYDRFAQIYRITDELQITDVAGSIRLGESSLRDTTDVFTDGRGLIELGLVQEQGVHRYEIKGRFSGGTDLLRESAVLRYRSRPATGRNRLDLEFDVEGRQFRDDSSFSLSSDNLYFDGKTRWRHAVSESVNIGAKLRGEMYRYDRRSDFEYDQNRWSASATANLRRGWNLSLDLEAGGGARSAPDTTEIDYDRAFVRGDLYWSLGSGLQLGLYSAMERRIYRDESVRTPYWDWVTEPDLSFAFKDEWTLRLSAPQEWLLYDQDDVVYYDMWLGRAGLELARRWGMLELGLESRWSWLKSPFDTEDEYGQPSGVLRVDWFSTGRLWFSLSEEIGRRHYEQPPDGSLELYSDYTFFRTTLLASYRIHEHLVLDGFLSDEPETHRRDEDDSRLTLFTLALRATF